MNKFVVVAFLAASVSLTAVGTASAFPPIQMLIYKLKPSGTIANPGEPFDPRASEVKPFEACEEAGGVIKRQIQDDGTIGYRCIV